jgi:DNA-binding winged helix-turn-helix (wHTH) protein
MRLCFADFEVDSDARLLLHGNTDVHVSPKAFDLLMALIDSRPKVVPKTDLQNRLWPSTFVSEANLPGLVSELRAALDDRPAAPRFIRTVHRVGYSFCGEVRASPGAQEAISCWLVHGMRRFPLGVGVNSIGRDPASTVWIESPDVSRRHSEIRIGEGRATLRDMGSKNGTFHREKRVELAELGDGDRIRVGPVRLTFRMATPGSPTRTQKQASKSRQPVKKPLGLD